MHNIQFKPNWIGKTIADIETVENPAGCIKDMHLRFTDGYIGSVGGVKGHDGYIAVVTEMPNDPSSPTPGQSQPIATEDVNRRSVQRTG